MPDEPEFPLPDIFDDWPEENRPKRNAPNRLVFPSPFSEYPGTVTTVCYLSAADYDTWYRKAGDGPPRDAAQGHWTLWSWKSISHLIKDFSITDVESSMFQEPKTLPDQRILLWLTQIIDPLTKMAASLPNWREPSKDT